MGGEPDGGRGVGGRRDARALGAGERGGRAAQPRAGGARAAQLSTALQLRTIVLNSTKLGASPP